MLSFIRKLFAATPTAARKPAARRSRLGLETLEDRTVPTVIGQLPTLDAGNSGPLGRSVACSDVNTVVRISEDSYGVRYSLLSHTGALQRTATVPGTNLASDYEPTVAMSTSGKFVVAWSHLSSYSPYKVDVRAQLFDASGNTVGGTIGVATSTSASFIQIYDEASAGMDSAGNFAVAYRYAYSPTDHDIYAKTYNSTGAWIGTATVNYDSADEVAPSVAMNYYGQYVVAYTRTLPDSTSVWESTYNIYDQNLGSAWVFYGDTPSAAIDGNGNVAVAFNFWDGSEDQIYVGKFTSAGQLQKWIHAGWGGEFQHNASISMDYSGRLVVAYVDDNPYNSSISRIFCEEYSASGVEQNWALVGYDGAYSSTPSVAMSSNGDYAVDYYFNNGHAYQMGTLYHF